MRLTDYLDKGASLGPDAEEVIGSAGEKLGVTPAVFLVRLASV